MKGSDRNKLILVIVLFVLAALVLAYQMNWIPGLGAAAPGTPTPRTNAGATNPPPAGATGTEDQGSHRAAPAK